MGHYLNMSFFNTVFYQPLFNILVWIYNTIAFQDIGIAIIFLTLFIRLILLPFSIKSIKSQKALQTLQPKMDALKLQYKDSKEELSRAMMKLYKDEHVNPLSSCLPLLVQLPFLFALYKVFIDGLNNFEKIGVDILYPFIHNPGRLETVAFGFLDLSQKSVVLAVLAGIAQYFQARMLSAKKSPQGSGDGAKDEDTLASMNRNMMYMMPVITVVVGISLPGGLALYWFVTTALMILQQWLQFRKTANTASLQ